ncbi:MAG: hypothetical protein QOH04_2204 [Sphingomonadales bacterium]|nr:hypothetical protein [Sphingomonadales bacterium]
MMRIMLIVPFCLAAAACGGGDNGANDQEAAAPPTIPAGTWNSEFEVKAFRSTDKTTPALKAKEGDKEQASSCVPGGQSERPPASLFSGAGYDCTYSNSYIKDGTINAALVCSRPELKGQVNMNVSGSYDAKSFEATVDSTSYLPGDGDFTMSRHVKGKVTPGACQPAAPAADAKGAAKGGAKPKAKAGG